MVPRPIREHVQSATDEEFHLPRSIWTGAISFGLVNVPVKLYSAVSKKTVRFHQLHEKDGVRIQQKRVCPADGEELSYDQIVKGYEITPDQYVVITPEELEALEPRKTKTIDIEDFVDLEDIDPIFYDHPYYLLPGTGAAKPYKLLSQAMEEAGKVAIARVVIRQKEQLVAIRPTGDILTMETMNFADEVIPHDKFDEAPGADVDTNQREVDMARQLIDSLSADFDPTKYHDTYRERVIELIERKAEGKEIAVQPAEEPVEVPDLMAALEASVNAARKNRESGGRGGDGAAGSGSGAGAKKKKAAAAKPKAAAKKPKAKAKT
jgi:DNA end-binding protein Ku